MKKHILCTLLVISMIAACFVPVSAEQVQAAADRIPVILTFLNRGTRVETAGKYDDTYTVVRTQSGYGLIRTEFLSMADEQPYSSWEGFAMWECNLYSSYSLTGEPLMKIQLNQRVTVLEELSGCYCVSYEEGIGYVARNQISRWAYSYSGGGSGSSGGQDGGDIVMRGQGNMTLGKLSAISQERTTDGSAVVKIEGAPVYLGFYNTGDAIVILDHNAEDMYVTVLMDGISGHLRADYLPDPEFSSRKGYAAGNAMIYRSADLYGEVVKQVWTNNEMTVLCEFDDTCFVSVGGVRGYIAKDLVRDTIAYYGGSGGSGSGGGEWSDPVL